MEAHDFERQRNLAIDFDGTLENISIRRSTGIEDCVVDVEMVRLSTDSSCFSFMAGWRSKALNPTTLDKVSFRLYYGFVTKKKKKTGYVMD